MKIVSGANNDVQYFGWPGSRIRSPGGIIMLINPQKNAQRSRIEANGRSEGAEMKIKIEGTSKGPRGMLPDTYRDPSLI